MDVSRFLSTPCTITPRSRVGTDEHGNPSIVDGLPRATKCFLERETRSEATGIVNVSADRWTVYFAPDETIDALSKVTVAGDDYEIFGPVGPAENPFSTSSDFLTATIARTA